MRKLAVLGVLALGACAMPMKREAVVVGETPCAAARFDIYFRENEARLTEAADQAIRMAAGTLGQCEVNRVRVLGLASATGGGAANQSLSERRARTVAEALNAAGLPAPAFEVTAAGDANATTNAGAADPLRRRTEVLIEARPRR